jgi:hypothetical protein
MKPRGGRDPDVAELANMSRFKQDCQGVLRFAHDRTVPTARVFLQTLDNWLNQNRHRKPRPRCSYRSFFPVASLPLSNPLDPVCSAPSQSNFDEILLIDTPVRQL